ncbi:MAG: phosphatidylserine decarboxylase [Chthoniobacterales bacterium]
MLDEGASLDMNRATAVMFAPLRPRGLILCFLLCTWCIGSHAAPRQDGPATLALKRLVAANPEIKRVLIASIEQAKRANPDPQTNPAQNLEGYYDFVSFAERAIPGDLLAPRPKASLYERIDQSVGYLYFICDQPLTELRGRGYFNNSLQYIEPYSSWLKTFVRSWGEFLNTPASWNEEYLRLALADEKFGLKKGWYEDPTHWRTFNEFFARRLKSPEQRPIASPTDESVVVSPVDGIPQGVWAADSSSHLIAKGGVPLKSGTAQSVAELIGKQSRYKEAFSGGTFSHIFLDVGDYHHYHFPLSGTVREVSIIPGQEVSGGYVTWDSRNHRYAFDPSAVGWQSLETRGVLILETHDLGLVALLPIGMSPVSSVTFEPIVKEGAEVRKGDRLGHFLFGGSDFVIVFQAGYEFTPDSPGHSVNQASSHRLMGEELGHLRRVAPGDTKR